MAVKKSKPRKFKQARKDAKSAAKSTFSGKAQARLKDPSLRLTADDKLALDEMKKMAKSDLGDKAYLNKKEYDAQQRAARETFREKMRAEFGEYGGKKATSTDVKVTDRRTPAEKKASLKSAAKEAKSNAKKPAGKGYSAGKTLNATGKARYDALIKEGVSPKKALNKALFAQEKATKAAAPKPITKNDALKFSAKGKVDRAKTLGKVETKDKPKFVQSTRVTSKEVAVRPKTSTTVVAKATPKPDAKPAKKFGKTRKAVKGFVGATVAAEIGSALKGSTEKDFREIQKLENRLAAAQGKPAKYKNMGSNLNLGESTKADLSNLANLVTMGAVGKTRRGRMDELNAKIAKAEKAKGKRIAKQRAAKPGIAPAGARSSSKINKTFVISGGATTSLTPGSRYKVKSGDTLSAIAKSAGLKTADLIAANKQFTTNPKYKGGNRIWSGTTVKIPTKKK